MKITLLQTDIKWADSSANIQQMNTAIDVAPSSDLYVLPEMWSTGFSIQPLEVAEGEDCEALSWMRMKAIQQQAAIAGSLSIKFQDGSFRNRFYFISPDPHQEGNLNIAYYDKHHLFTYGGEHQHYTAGSDRVVVEWKGVRFLLMVCYDLRFPVWSRNHNDYDCILYVASWPESRISAWRSLLIARAIENQCYVAGVNRIGDDPLCHYCGSSMLIDPYGRIVAQCPDHQNASVTSILDMEALQSFRHKFPVLADRDP